MFTAFLTLAGVALGGLLSQWTAMASARAARQTAADAQRAARQLEADRRRDERRDQLYQDMLKESEAAVRRQQERIAIGPRAVGTTRLPEAERAEWRARLALHGSTEVLDLWDAWVAVLAERMHFLTDPLPKEQESRRLADYETRRGAARTAMVHQMRRELESWA